MNFGFLDKYWSYFLSGMINTLIISIIVVFFSFIFAFVVALMRMSKVKILNVIANVYVEIIRGTPMLLQILICFVLIHIEAPAIKTGNYQIDFSVLIPGLIALVINSTAYVSETIRAGIESVDTGQIEAAKCIGLEGGVVYKLVIIPQAIRTILPAIGNELVTIIKDSSLLSSIGVYELMHNSDIVRSNTYIPFEPLIVCALLYFVMTFSTSLIVRRFEKSLQN
jgi:His/Glu/Gln/Arg/opine family amino acid ABC transporter permease subunit